MHKNNMALKTTLASCLVFSLCLFLEMSEASGQKCDPLVDITYLIDASAKLSSEAFHHEKILLQELLFILVGRVSSQNKVNARIKFYHSSVFEYYSPNEYGSYEDRDWLEQTAQTATQSKDVGDDVIQAILAASKPGPNTACRRKRGARRVVVVVADAVDESPISVSMFRNVLKERRIEVLALTFGTNGTLERLNSYLNPNGTDIIIKLRKAPELLYLGTVITVVDELCKETQEMREYREKLSAFFRANYTYNGHTYYLSREYFHNLTQVYDTCSSAGGYLVVVNDQQEYDAMKQYYIDNDPGYGIIIDGTDAHKEGVWTLLSGEPLPFVDWMENHPRPNVELRDCLGFSWAHLQMFDERCYGNPSKYPYLFLCEVPETCDA